MNDLSDPVAFSSLVQRAHTLRNVSKTEKYKRAEIEARSGSSVRALRYIRQSLRRVASRARLRSARNCPARCSSRGRMLGTCLRARCRGR